MLISRLLLSFNCLIHSKKTLRRLGHISLPFSCGRIHYQFRDPAVWRESENHQMPSSFSTMNHQTQLDHHLSFSLQFLKLFGPGYPSGAQTLAPITSLNNLQEPIKLPREIAPVPQQFDDLSAVVQKCNVKGMENTFLPMDRPALFNIPAYPSGLLSHSKDRMDADNNACLDSMTKGGRINRGEAEEGQEESLKRKRSVLPSGFLQSSSLRENHILSERLRRSEMNESLAQMRSLLPNPTGKSDKASIVTDTIKYIHSLQRQLAIHSKKHAITILPDGTTLPLKSQAMNSEPNADESECTECDNSMCSKHWDEKLTVNYNGNDIFITINCVNKANLLPSIILAVEAHNIEVMDAFVSITDKVAFVCLHVKAPQILDSVAKEALSGTLNKLINSEFQISFKL